MLRSVRDIVLAHDEGRVHVQRAFKNTGLTGDNAWQDWSYSSGQPAYDARIGEGLAFNPFVAAGNDAVFFPPIPAGMERRLSEIEMVAIASNSDQVSCDFAFYDLLGVYPLIDGDSTDPQVMDNALILPRFTDGKGVMPVLVNHVAPSTATATATVEFTNSDGVAKSVTWGVGLPGINRAAQIPAATGGLGSLYAPLTGGDVGVRSIDSITFPTPPGGLWALYMCRPLGNISRLANLNSGVPVRKDFALGAGFNLPLIPDGSWLGTFYMPRGSTRSITTIHAQFTFVWG